jgi:hypothetical protein
MIGAVDTNILLDVLIPEARVLETSEQLLGGLPAEVNLKIAFIINPRAAKALRLTIAPDVMYGTT